jgi:hypothetical protein
MTELGRRKALGNFRQHVVFLLLWDIFYLEPSVESWVDENFSQRLALGVALTTGSVTDELFGVGSGVLGILADSLNFVFFQSAVAGN